MFLQDNHKNMIKCIGYEVIFSKFVKINLNKTYLDSMGCQGYVTVCGSLWKK